MANTPLDCDRRAFLGGTGTLSLLGGATMIGGGLLGAPHSEAQTLDGEKTDETVAIATNNALEGAYGVNPRQRRNHTKGVGCTGTFVGNPEMRRYSRSKLFSGDVLPVVSRFSIAGGDPAVKDSDRSPRGLGIEFRLADGSLHHMTILNTPMFFARVPQTFLDKFIALKIDPATGKADPGALPRFLASHPEVHNQVEFLNANNPPRSYAEDAYFGIHTFFLVGPDDRRTKVKIHFEPRDGIHRLTTAEMATAPDNFLEAALAKRFRRGPAEWDLYFTLGEDSDEELDPTVQWPTGRPKIRGGTLQLHDALPSEQAGSFLINFDPMMIADGMAASADPILLFRSPSYAISHGRRLQDL